MLALHSTYYLVPLAAEDTLSLEIPLVPRAVMKDSGERENTQTMHCEPPKGKKICAAALPPPMCRRGSTKKCLKICTKPAPENQLISLLFSLSLEDTPSPSLGGMDKNKTDTGLRLDYETFKKTPNLSQFSTSLSHHSQN